MIRMQSASKNFHKWVMVTDCMSIRPFVRSVELPVRGLCCSPPPPRAASPQRPPLPSRQAGRVTVGTLALPFP